MGRFWLAGGLERADGFAESDGRAVPRPDGLALAPDVLVPDVLAPDVLAGAELGGLDRCAVDRRLEAAVAEAWLRVAGAVVGLNVATDSMAPATRQTARMLASSGITVPCPAKGPASLRSRRRRRWARSSRW